MSNWPTIAEINAQQDPFDVNGTYPYEYRFIIVELVEQGVFEEQLRSYNIASPMDENNTILPEPLSIERGRRFRLAAEGEKADMHVINGDTSDPIGLVVIG